MNKKGKTITFRLSSEEYEKCLNEAIRRTNEEKRIFKLSEIIREAINVFLKNG